MLTVSGSTKRDANRWYQYNIEEEISNIKTWYKNRLDYLDEYFEGLYE
jgi:hypothetical protein